MRGHPDKLCDLIADNVLDECLKHDPASRVACEVMATRGHIIVAGEITTKVKPDVFNIVRDTLRDVGYDPKGYQIDCYIHDQSPDIVGAVEPELAEGEDEDTLGAGDQGVMVGYACNETPEYLPMPVVAAQRLVTLLEISRMTGVIPDIGPDGKVQVTMEYNGDTPVRITTVVVSVQHKEDTDINKLADLLDEYVFPLAFDGMPIDDAEIILNPSGKFVQGGPDADTSLTGRKLMVDSYGVFAPPRRRCVFRQRSHQGGPFRGIHGPVHRQKPCGGGLVRKVPSHAGLCHRESRAGHGGGGYLRHRYGLCRRLSGRGGALRVRLNACGDHRPA